MERLTILGVVLAFGVAAVACGDDKKQDPRGKKAFNNYVAKSKGTEALMNLRKLAEGARAYYMDPPVTGITPGPARFPGPSAGPTPALGTCCKDEVKKQCAPDPSLWKGTTWKWLRFDMTRPHYFSYRYETKDNGKNFTVRAYGDLDCDGEYSTFELSGKATPEGPQVSPNLIRHKEME